MEYLPAVDFFGSHLHWYVNHKKKLYTRLGGILSLLSILICAPLFIILIKELINRNNPQTTENDYSNNEFKKIKFREKKIYIPWSIGDYNTHQVNFTGWIYPIVYYYYGERDIKSNTMISNYKILNYTLCKETNLKNVNYFLDDTLNFDTFYCIDMDDLLMGGDWFHDFVYYIEIDFYLCEDGVNIGTEGKKCTDYDKLIENIGYNNAWHIEIYYPEIQFKPKNKNNPMEIFYNAHFYNFNKLDIKVERLYLKEYTMIDDQGWIFNDKKNYSLWGYDKFEYDSYSKTQDGKDIITDFTSSKMYSLVIYINKNSKIYTRQYTKLLNSIGNILSVIHGIFVFFRFFSQFFTEAYQDKEIINNIFVQKYLMKDKYKKINIMTKNKNYSSNLGDLIRKNIIISDPKLNEKKNLYKSSEHLTIFSRKDNVKPIMIKKAEQSKFVSKLEIPKNFNNINSNQNFQKSRSDNKSNLNLNISNSNADNSNIKICSKEKSLMSLKKKNRKKNAELSWNNFELYKIQSYMKDEYKKDNNINNKPFKRFSSIDFNFPYYLYLLNIFNKSFGVSRSCFVNQKFLDSWEYMINVFDITEFIKMQTNIDLINKLIFELKSTDENNNIWEI